MAIRWLDEEPTQKKQGSIRWLDEDVQPAAVTKQPEREIGGIEDVSRGAVSGLSLLPRGASKIGQQIGDIAGTKLREMIGKEPLTEEQLLNKPKSVHSQLLESLDYDPQSFAGKAAKFGGEVVSTLPIGAGVGTGATFGARLGSSALKNALIGGGISGLSAAESGADLSGIAKTAGVGASIGGMFGGAIPILGEKVQPKIAELVAGIPKESYSKALKSIMSGGQPFKKGYSETDFIPLSKKIESSLSKAKDIAGKDVGEEVGKLLPMKQASSEQVLGAIDDTIEKTYQGADFSTAYDGAKSTINRIKSKLKLNKDDLYEVGNEILSTSEMIENGLPVENFAKIVDESAGVTLPNLHQAKLTLQEKIPYNKTEWTQKDRLLDKLQNELKGIIEDISPEYSKANKYYSDLIDANKAIGGITPEKLLKTHTRGGEMKQYGDKLKALEKMLPKGNMFMEELEDLALQQDFTGGLSKWMSLMAARQGIGKAGQLAAGAGAAGLAGFDPVLGTSLILQQSPSVQRELLKLYAKSPRITPQITRGVATGAAQFRE